MTTLDKIKAEIEQIKPWDLPCDKRTPEHIRDMVLEIIDKYAEQAEIQADYDRQKASGMTDEEWEYGKAEQEPKLEQLRAEVERATIEMDYETAQEALAVIDRYIEQEPCRVKNELNVELNELKPCNDVVSRQAVCDYIAEYVNHEYSTDTECEMVDAMIDGIQHIPSVRPQEQTGHWKRISMDRYTTHAQYWYECDKCGVHNLGNTDFCPNCGARMESEDKE